MLQVGIGIGIEFAQIFGAAILAPFFGSTSQRFGSTTLRFGTN